MNINRLKETFFQLVQIDSISKQEGKIISYLKNKLIELGLEVIIDKAGEAIGGESGNLIARFNGGRAELPPLLFAAHVDTVQPGRGINPVEKDGVFYSAGETILGADDKAGVAILLEVIHLLGENAAVYRDVEFVFTVAEELGMLGASNLDYSLLNSRMGFILDGDEKVGTIINHVPYRSQVRIEIKGREAHAGSGIEEGINAIQIAASGINQSPLGLIDPETTVNFGTISGGSASNIVPEKATILGEVRSRDKTKLEARLAEIKENFMATARRAGGEASIVIENTCEGVKVEEGSPVVFLAAQVAGDIGLAPNLAPVMIVSDMNILNKHGIESILLGIGMKQPHSKEEHISLESLTQAVKWVMEIIQLRNGHGSN
ncbi:MAG: M20/M25/M40 family metallo-hydrolase [bacterium]|nr:M20/M25/M40 family metallo-hydrolase [bacterium]